MGIVRQTYYNYLGKIDDFSDLVEQSKEQAIDFVENALMEQIESGNTQATIFYLKTKGRNRGYGENIDINHNAKINTQEQINSEHLNQQAKEYLIEQGIPADLLGFLD